MARLRFEGHLLSRSLTAKQEIENLEKQLEQQSHRLDRADKTILTLTRMLKETEERTISLERGFEAAIRAVEINRTDGEWYAETN